MCDSQNRWIALIILCLGDLMIVLDTTIVNVALPSIQQSLGFSDTGLVWVINAYMLTFGGCLLLGGRLGDLFGYRRMFLAGIGLFTLASLACGIAQSQWVLVGARAIQGVGGAVVSAVALSLIMNLFTSAEDRAKAMGVFGFVSAGGGAIGVFLGGFLTNLLSWHWIFLVNIPVGVLVSVWALIQMPNDSIHVAKSRLDWVGAFTITTALMGLVYGIVNAEHWGWASGQTWAVIMASLASVAVFIGIESKVASPLMPLHLFKIKSVVASNIIAVLWAAAMFAWFFISALYLQLIAGLSPLGVGLVFLPANIVMGVMSLGVSAKLVMRLGVRNTLVLGLLTAAVGLAVMANVPVSGNGLGIVISAMMLMGLGGGIAFNPMLLAAMSGVPADESGAASGLVNTAFMMGGAVGLAILVSLASVLTRLKSANGLDPLLALHAGYQGAFWTGVGFAVLAAVVGWLAIDQSIAADELPVSH